MSDDTRLRRLAPRLLALIFAISGALHFVRPRPYEQIVPHALPNPRGIVYLSGLAELLCAAGLLVRARWSPAASTALLLAVLPANVQMALDVTTAPPPRSKWKVAAVWLRLPLQLPLIWAAWRARR